MKRLLMAITLLATGAADATGIFECKVLDAVVKIPGKLKIESALNRDPKIQGEVFTVRPQISLIKGSPLYQTQGQKVEVLRSSADEHTLMSRIANTHGDDDMSILTLQKFEGAWSFKHYNSWHGLLTSGPCKEL